MVTVYLSRTVSFWFIFDLVRLFGSFSLGFVGFFSLNCQVKSCILWQFACFRQVINIIAIFFSKVIIAAPLAMFPQSYMVDILLLLGGSSLIFQGWLSKKTGLAFSPLLFFCFASSFGPFSFVVIQLIHVCCSLLFFSCFVLVIYLLPILSCCFMDLAKLGEWDSMD